MADPFLKWAGGKRKLLPALKRLVPETRGRYFEPFLGGGALFFGRHWARATISDVNEDLVVTYLAVQQDVESVIGLLQSGRYVNDEATYYAVRDSPLGFDTERAARFIYLNRTGFNGLYRVNQRGKFNVPFGHYKNPTICDVDRLRAASVALNCRGVKILEATFEEALAGARSGDVVYCDPPHWPASKTACFTAFSAGGFGPDDQRKLRDVAIELSRRRVHVVLSNADVPKVRELYSDPRFTIEEVQARRNINSDGAKRGPVGELIITAEVEW